MAINFTFDESSSSSLEIFGNVGARMGRGFVVTGLTCAAGDDPYDIMWKVMSGTIPGMPPQGDVITRGSYTMYLSRFEIKGVFSDTIRGVLWYENMTGATPTSVIITRSTRSTAYQTNHLPYPDTNGYYFLRCGWFTVDVHGDVIGVPTDTITTNLTRSATTFQCEMLKYGHPNDTLADYVDHVNENTWHGFSKGKLKIVEYSTTWSKYQGYTQTRIVIQEFGKGADWSKVEALRNNLTGRFIDPDPADVSAMLAEPYKYGLIWPSTPALAEEKGIIRFSANPIVDFSALGL